MAIKKYRSNFERYFSQGRELYCYIIDYELFLIFWEPDTIKFYMISDELIENQTSDYQNQTEVSSPYNRFPKNERDEEEWEERGKVTELVDKGRVVGSAYSNSEANERNSHFKGSDVHAGH